MMALFHCLEVLGSLSYLIDGIPWAIPVSSGMRWIIPSLWMQLLARQLSVARTVAQRGGNHL